MLNSKNENVRNLILNFEFNEALHQNMSEDAIKTAICELIFEEYENGRDIIQKWFGISNILDRSLRKIFNYKFSDFCYISQAYAHLDQKDPHENDYKESGDHQNWGEPIPR